MTEQNKRIWNKLAISGTYRGHPTGPFSMSSQTFSEIEKNFRNDNIPIPIDWDHAMEQPVSESIAKARGDAPAAGWIHAVEARPDGSLWGETEWLPDTRQKILSGAYKFVSPAIRFNATDTISGLKVGAKLSSAAVTNRPFLKALPPLQASDATGAFLCSEMTPEEILTLSSSSGYALSPNEYLPKFRSILKLDEMASADDIIEKVDRLAELCELADGDVSATVEGICLSTYILPIREFMRMPANTTLSDLLEAVVEMTEDSQGVEMSDIPSVNTPEQTTQLPAPVITPKETEPVMETITLTEHTVKLSEAVTAAVANATAPITLQLRDAESVAAKALSDKAESDAKVLALTEQIATRDAAVASARVDEAFTSYKETKKLSDDDKEAMAITLSTKPELFEKLYPKLTPAQSVLLHKVTLTDTSPATKTVKVTPDFAKILSDVKVKNPTLDYDAQFNMAYAEQTALMAG